MTAEYLITGGAGFIGSNIAELLVREGKRVRVLDSFLTGNRDNLGALTGPIDLVEGDIRDAAVVRRAVTGVRYVLHIAALPSVLPKGNNYMTMRDRVDLWYPDSAYAHLFKSHQGRPAESPGLLNLIS